MGRERDLSVNTWLLKGGTVSEGGTRVYVWISQAQERGWGGGTVLFGANDGKFNSLLCKKAENPSI